jgi:hypothetical protein
MTSRYWTNSFSTFRDAISAPPVVQNINADGSTSGQAVVERISKVTVHPSLAA